MVMVARPAFARVNKQWINEYKSKTNIKGDEKKIMQKHRNSIKITLITNTTKIYICK